MISGPEVGVDGIGFPVVTWREHRGPGSPAGTGTFRIECRIAKDLASGMLLFVARGNMRNRTFEAGRPWESLISFGYHSALHRYLTPLELQMREHLLHKTKAGKILMGDGGKALLAEFGQDDFFDVSCPESAQPDLSRLQLVLTREFVNRREALIDRHCKIAYRWPKDDNRVVTFDPARRTWPGETPLPGYLDALSWVAAGVIVVGGGALLLWLLGVIAV
jgi:hypothetical protein